MKKSIIAGMITLALLASLATTTRTETAVANPFFPPPDGPVHYLRFTSDSPKNVTYRTGNILFSLTLKTNEPVFEIYKNCFYILDAPGNMELDQAHIDLKPTNTSTRLLHQSSKYGTEFYTETTWEYTVPLTNLKEGPHYLIWGFEPESDISAGWNKQLVYTLTPDLCFTVDLPEVTLTSLCNQTFNTPDVPLTFSVDEPSSQFKYSLDGQPEVTIWGNATLTGLQNGVHTVTVYAAVRRYNATIYYIEGYGYLGGMQTEWLTNKTSFTVNLPASTPTPTLTPENTPQPSPTNPPSPTETPKQFESASIWWEATLAVSILTAASVLAILMQRSRKHETKNPI